MSVGLYLIIGIFVCGGIIAIVLRKYKTEAEHYENNGIPVGMEEEYQLALNPGADGKPLLYNLTTCTHCVRVHDFFDAHGIAHNDITVDYFVGPARSDVLAKLRTYNPRSSFPTVVFPDGTVVVGYKESALREAIGIPNTISQ